MLMKKLLFTLVALLATMTTFAQTNLTSGKTVVPLGGLKSFLPEGVLTADNHRWQHLQRFPVPGECCQP